MASKITPEMLELLLPQKPPPALLIPRWGVVTSTNPLRVQLAGDDDPLPIAPKSLAVGLAVGRVVWCVLQGTDLLIIDQLGGPTGAKLVKTANQTYSANTWTKVTWDAVEYGDAGGFASTADSRLVIPTTGRYMVGASVAHPTGYGSAHLREACIVRGDAAPADSPAANQLVRGGAGNNPATGTSRWDASLSVPANFTAGEYVTLWFRSSAASSFGAPNGAAFNLWAQAIA